MSFKVIISIVALERGQRREVVVVGIGVVDGAALGMLILDDALFVIDSFVDVDVSVAVGSVVVGMAGNGDGALRADLDGHVNVVHCLGGAAGQEKTGEHHFYARD